MCSKKRIFFAGFYLQYTTHILLTLFKRLMDLKILYIYAYIMFNWSKIFYLIFLYFNLHLRWFKFNFK